ncbi:glycoside hydrolase family 65 protein [Evansella tamaricis]|uniref:Glycoside hydrolase family 65 protein n=1 Tax=Evansella tamaricis TaxID=2069301 RepID=A0ABS6JG99_9BACI|nr:glycosyl hydrolase family 65 protein [Evansella tamaricis]MBU9712677.1 glycoside hydrolase family 65 protein [Evansella tamaricis]
MMNYTSGNGNIKNWVLSEEQFHPDQLGKCESIMYLGNGYLGLRSATEEPYLQEKRNLFVNGTFNQGEENEVTELPNLADMTRFDMKIDGERFSLEFGKTKEYVRQLNLKTAELTRKIQWISPKGKEIWFQFRRFVSLHNLHLIGMKLEVESVSHPIQLTIESGINGQMTNSGSQHFLEGERRVHQKCALEMIQTTKESKINIILNAVHTLRINGEEIRNDPEMNMSRRKVWLTYNVALQPSDQFVFEKLATVYTSVDKEFSRYDKGMYDVEYQLDDSIKYIRKQASKELQELHNKGYEMLFNQHAEKWETIWNIYKLEVDSTESFDQLALRFSLYHLIAMTPAHDEKMGIGAKALSGEGYRGHSFWDTEIFILPFFTYSNQAIAKSLLTYRYLGLESAKRKAKANGYEGAMYPWEAAKPSDGEVTPEWGDIDIVTGKPTKIWPGLIEQHITADIAFAIYQYTKVTGDKDFLIAYGYEIIFETATFWASRLEWSSENGQYYINDVIGPDEYKEHVNNNAYTNYMAYFNLKLAIRFVDQLKQDDKKRFLQMDKKLDLNNHYLNWLEKAEKLYLPEPRAKDHVIPQDDTYLSLKELDLSKYKNQDSVRGIYKDYNPEQINHFQVTKQADTLLIFYLLEQTFLADDERLSQQVKSANFHFYEPRTLHDSSLSLSTHVILACDLGKVDLAYEMFTKLCETDLGPSMDTSNEGIHAASIGGMWTAAVFGFGGVRLYQEELRINPQLPTQWKQLKFVFHWRGHPLHITITKSTLRVEASTMENIRFRVFEKAFTFRESIEIPLEKGSLLSY